MSKPTIHWRKIVSSNLLLRVLVTSLAIAFLFTASISAQAQSRNGSTTPQRAKYALIVILDGGHPELYNATNAPFINSLMKQGSTYSNAQAQVPADSITNIMGVFTGTDATHHGFPYETFWDYHYNHLIELDETPVLPPGITEDRNVGRACTLFQSAKAAGLRTAFIAKYPAYDVLDGPNTCSVYSGIGVDDLRTPTFANFKGTPQQYDRMNFEVVRDEIQSGDKRPNLFGLYAVAPNSIMKTYGIDSPQVAQVIQFEDQQIAQTVATLKSAGIYNQTEIAVINDHGNTALTEAIPDHGPGSIDQFLIDNGIPTAQTTADRVALVYLQNPSQTHQAIQLLLQPQNKQQFGIQAITPASGLGAYMVTPQYRTPSFIVWPMDGAHGTPSVVYASVPLNKLAEHGGRGKADQDVMIVMEGPGVQAGFTTDQHVWVMQVGASIAADMCLDLANATLAPLPGTNYADC